MEVVGLEISFSIYTEMKPKIFCRLCEMEVYGAAYFRDRSHFLISSCLSAKNLHIRFQKLFQQKLGQSHSSPTAVFPASNGACPQGETSMQEAEEVIYC